ncbi:MAG: ABC transporter permease, partial [Pseudomonadota bacterium]
MRWWLYRKFIFQKKIFLEPTTLFSLMGISLGVAFLVVSMAGFSGFTKSLKSSIIDVSGDVNIFKRGSRIAEPEQVASEIRDAVPDLVDLLGFVQVEVLVAANGKLGAVILQGLPWDKAQDLPELKGRQVQTIKPGEEGMGEPAFLGKVVAQTLKVKTGDSFKVILPRVSKSSATRVSPEVQTFYVHSILDFGKYDFNERWMIADQKPIQKLAKMGEKINGFRIKLKDSDKAAGVAGRLQEVLGWDYSVRDWSMT